MLRADSPRKVLRAGPAPHKPTLSPANTAAMQLQRAKPHMPGIPRSPDPLRKSAVTGQSPRNGVGMAGSSSAWARAPCTSLGLVRDLQAGAGGAQAWLCSQLCCCPRSGQVTCPPTCCIFRASTPEPRLLLTKPRASDTTLLQGEMSALATKSLFVYFFFSRNGAKSDSRGWEALSTPPGCLYSP